MVANEFSLHFNHNTSTRGHPLKLFVPDSRINARAHFFVLELWNNLPDNVVCASNSLYSPIC